MLGTEFYIRQLPEKFVESVANGTLRVAGNLILDTNNGNRIVGQLEQIAVNNIAKTIGTSMLNAGGNPIQTVSSVVTNIQNQKIIHDVKNIQNDVSNVLGKINTLSSKINTIGSLSWINTGLGVANIGVSCVGIAVISAKMNNLKDSIEKNFKAISKDLDEIKRDVHEVNLISKHTYFEECEHLVYSMNYYINQLKDSKLSELIKRDVNLLLNQVRLRLKSLLEMYFSEELASINLINIIIPMYASYMALYKAYIAKLYIENGEIYELNSSDLEPFEVLSQVSSMKKIVYSAVRSTKELLKNEEVTCIMGMYANVIGEPLRLLKSQQYVYSKHSNKDMNKLNEKVMEQQSESDLLLISYE